MNGKHSKKLTLGRPPRRATFGIRSSLLKDLPRPRYSFSADSIAQAVQWQQTARRAFEKCLGDAPPRVALRATKLEMRQLKGYRRTMFALDTAPNIQALCWLCIPDRLADADSRGRSPAMIATPGHGIGAKDLLAMTANGAPRKEGKGYQKDYALQAVRLGYPVLVIEPLGFGERQDADHAKPKALEQPCHAASCIALAMGTTLARLRINDIQRGIDYLQDVPEIDPTRIGLMGISGGGQMTLWTTALEPRLKLAVVSGYFNEFRSSILGIHHCICNFVPGLARDFDGVDLGALVAPRPILIESGTRDEIFPIPATRRAVSKLRKIYDVFNASECVEVDIFDADHQWSGRKLKSFLRKWL